MLLTTAALANLAHKTVLDFDHQIKLNHSHRGAIRNSLTVDCLNSSTEKNWRCLLTRPTTASPECEHLTCTVLAPSKIGASTQVKLNLHKLISYSIVYRSVKYRLKDYRIENEHNSASECDGVAATVFVRRNAVLSIDRKHLMKKCFKKIKSSNSLLIFLTE